MTLFQALYQSELLNCGVIHRETGIQTTADSVRDVMTLENLPYDGWHLSDTPSPITFEGEFLGCGIVEGFHPLSTSFVIMGKHLTSMPVRTRVKVSLTPL